MKPCGHSGRAEGCRVCHLAACDPRYRRRWGAGPCRHLGPETGARAWCPSCAGRVQLKLRACALHGACTTDTPAAGHACCAGCPDRAVAPSPYPGPVVRNLLYHVYPRRGGGAWQRNVGLLLRRIRHFNGRRVVAIATDRTCDPAGHVRDLFAGHAHEFVEVANDPGLREARTLPLLLDRVRTDDPCQVTLWAHAKGVTRPDDGGNACHPWADLLYETYLDYLPLVERLLAERPVCGSFKKVGHGFGGSRSSWHYSGGWYWLRNRETFARDWRAVDAQWWGSESWPGLHFAADEAACIFHEGVVPSLDLYSMDYLRGTVLPEYERWRPEHARDRTPEVYR